MKTKLLSIVSIFGIGLAIASSYAISSNPVESGAMNAGGTMNTGSMGEMGEMKNAAYTKPSKDELKKKLTPLQFDVTQNDATERPFKNEFWDNKKHGIYVDIVSGEPLFSSTDKFKSGTGWPSFTQPIQGTDLVTKEDKLLFYTRVELRSKLADSHLGHVFNDGPEPTGKRYCINSASLRFVPKENLSKEGYEKYASLFSK